MNRHNIITVYVKELKHSLRDRRTLLSMIIIPTFVIPALTYGVGKIATKVIAEAREETPVVMLLPGGDSPGVVAALLRSRTMKIVPASANYRQLISDKKIRAAVKLPAGFEAGLKAGTAESVLILYYEGELKSSLAAGELDRFFRDLRDQTVKARLAEHQLPASLIKPFEVKRENVAPPEKVGGNLIGGLVPYLIIILCFTGAMYPAMDLTAGEKERGTMETLLCSPVARGDLVLGKFLMVLTGSLSAMLLALTSMGIMLFVMGALMTGAGGGRAAGVAVAAAQAHSASATLPSIDPDGILGVMALVLPVAVLFSAILFTVSLFAKSYREAQSYVAPMTFIVILPAAVGLLPGIDLNVRLALVPLLNLSLVCKEMLSGVWHWSYIALIFGSSCVYAGAALALTVKMFNREDVIFRA